METNEKSRVLDMTRGNPFRLVLKFALPLFFGNLLQQFYNPVSYTHLTLPTIA